MNRLTPEQLLAIDKFLVDDEEHHISLADDACQGCAARPCLVVCPAGLYTLKGDRISFDDAGCLECGTCRVVCPQAVRWRYPRGGFGIIYRYG
ncbi:MAG: 4Fe-4S dicluster domain-containing protein [Syntrophomonadaceae bacterium]|nr:4Fe-4S dicluster domain-containing protein [Syntrophomonadaceae bacterium]MDH7498608.1 4Fe-4S dicluster domain-containing protein [Syntrophomonadaceae bacterium]